jgi:hypothetical protein
MQGAAAMRKQRRLLQVEELESRIVPSAAVYDGLTIPTNHARLMFTPALLSQARQYFASHPFTPSSSDPYGNALRYQMTGETAYAQNAITQLMNFTISSSELNGTASDTYRWNDWVPIVFDWVYDQMSASQRSTFISRYNGYADTMMQKSWGGPGMEANNYYWGYLRNEFNWGVATYYENTAEAQKFLDDALKTRWQNDFLPWTNSGGAGGIPQEGTQYGRYMLSYPVSILVSAKLMGRDLFQETNFYQGAADYLFYSTSTGPVANKDGSSSYAQLFPFNDDEKSSGYPAANDSYYTDFMTIVAEESNGTPLGAEARQWLANVSGTPSWLIAAEDSGGPAQSLSSLPLDYYAPGPGFLYAKNTWAGNATSLEFQLGVLSGVGHYHLDNGSFQMLSNDQWLTKDSTGYSDVLTGYNGVGTDSTDSTVATNGLLLGGLGLAYAYTTGDPVVTRLESTPDYTFASVNLSAAYRSTDSRFDNPYSQSVVRDFVYIRALDTLLVFDRVQSAGSSPSTVAKTFLLHFVNAPMITGPNSVVGVNGNMALQLTTLTPSGQSGPSYKVVNEHTSGQATDTDAQYRLEETTSGQVQSYLINVLQARGASATGLTASMTEDASSFTITLSDPVKGTAVITLSKGMTSTGGSFSFSASGTPTSSTPLTSNVQGIQITDNGPVWAGSSSSPPPPPAPPPSPPPAPTASHLSVSAPSSATAGTSFQITVSALDSSNNTVSGYTGTVHLTSTDAAGVLPVDYTFTSNDAGTHTFIVTLKTAGNGTVTVTDTSQSSVNGSAGILVNAAAASTFTVSGYPTTTTAGVAHNFTVTARDAYGNTATGYTGTVHFTSSDPNAALPADSTLQNGTGTFSATLNTTGTQSLIATDTVTASIIGTELGIAVQPAPTPTTTWHQATAADFSAGTNSGTAVANASSGGLQLNGNFTDDFSGSTLSSSWTKTSWSSSGSVKLSGGIVTLAGTGIFSANTVGLTPVEARVKFGASSYQHFGLATDLSTASGNYWAIFSTFGTTNTLYARVNVNGSTTDVSLGSLPTGFHVYRVQPVSGGFQFYVDGTLKKTIIATFPSTTGLKIALSAYNTSNAMQADWVHLISYPSSGTFTSVVYDAGRTATWGVANWSAKLPAGTTITVQTRSGNTATPDSSWSAWASIINGEIVSSPSTRYLQYRVILTTNDPTATPILLSIDFNWS